MNHEHHHCQCNHARLAYCKKCNVVYCKDCKKEWVEKTEGYWYYYPWQPITYTNDGTAEITNDSYAAICQH